MSQQSSDAAVAFVTPYGVTEAQKIAKAVDDYMNNETEDLILPEEEEREPQSLEEALLGE